MKLKFVPVDYSSFDFEGRNYIILIGRTEKGKKICVVDSYEPNFWVILKEGSEKKAESIAQAISKVKVKKGSRVSKIVRTEILNKNFIGKEVKAIRVFVTNHKDAHEIASEIGDLKEIEARREYDIPIITKYIKEKGVEPLNWYDIEGEILDINSFGGLADSLNLDTCISVSKITKSNEDKKFEPRILTYDIEADEFELGKGKILMISLYGEDIKRVLTWKKPKHKQNFVEVFKDEGEMIEKFVEYVNKYDPDILAGYFSDGFDLPYLKSVSERDKIKLSLGIDEKGPSFTRGRIPSGKITGIVHIDLFRFIDAVFSQYLQSETLSLGEVATELVGEGKNDFDFSKLTDMKDSDWNDFFSYNLQDSAVTYKLALKIWPDILEFTNIIKEPLFDVTRDRMATHVENYILHNLDRFNEIAEKRPMNNEIMDRRAKGKFEGAFVFKPKPGLYEKLVMFDFTSMYASVIVSYNLSKSTYIDDNKFSKKQGFFPIMLSEIIEKRKKHKKEYTKNPSGILRARSNAYKLLANAAYGYQAFSGARYYCREAAASTARLARENILNAIEKIGKDGYQIVYSDTDSIAFLQGNKTKKQIQDFLDDINSKLPGIMELDLEGFYSRGLFVSKRTTTEGAKKKYALIDENEKFKIRGFETVRRDWCGLARDLQNEVLRSILKQGNEKEALKIIKRDIDRLKERKVDLKDLIIRTQLRRSINDYLSEGPHVIAAKKMQAQGTPVSQGMLIRYFIGETSGKNKSKRIGDKVFLPDEKAKYDVDYYLNNQILPAVENIIEVFGVDIKEFIQGESQKKLF